MSKAKKIISMLLAVLMVLTMAPVSGLAALADDGYEYATPSLTPVSFTVDTTATTEVIRVSAGAGTFTNGNVIVAAGEGSVEELVKLDDEVKYLRNNVIFSVIVI